MAQIPKFNSVDEYFKSLSENSLETLLALRAIIQETVPNCTELLNYEMPAYALTEGGKRDKQIMIAGYKKFVGFYVGNNILNHFEKELKAFTVGKASVQFPVDKPLPKELIKQIILLKLNSVK